MSEPDDDCILVCAWDTYHYEAHEQHGVLVCSDCERLMRCIAHQGHGAMLADGTMILTELALEEAIGDTE